MSIYFDETRRLFKLDAGTDFSYVFMIAGEEKWPVNLYCGPHLKSTAGLETRFFPKQRGFSPTGAAHKDDETWSPGVIPQEFSTHGLGDYRVSSAAVRTPDGFDAVDAGYVSHRIYAGKPKLAGLPASFAPENGVETLELTLRDEFSQVEFILSYSVFADVPVIARNVRVVNRSAQTVSVEKIASITLDFIETPFDLCFFHGAWAREREFTREPLEHGIKVLGSKRGLSSHQMNPFFMLAEPDADEVHGRIYGVSLLYSGNFAAEIERDQFDAIRAVCGINPDGFAWRLAPGGEFQSPEAALVFSGDGFGGMSRALHDFFREHVIRSAWRDRERPVLINNWEATYFDFDAEKIMHLARTAAGLGIGMLVLDDGWFGRRDTDNAGLGDWFPHRGRLPEGIGKLAEGIHSLGMKFGIWFEPEMISPDSDLYRAHPDWALQIPGRPLSVGRRQFVLDMSRPEVIDCLFEQISRVIEDGRIDYIKWDANRNITEAGSGTLPPERQGETLHRFVLGTYELHERLIARFPELLIEGCSGGGGRFDGGMLYYAPQIWTSDDSDAAERVKIQYNTSFAYPLSSMGAHVSACPNHQTGRVTPFASRGNVAMFGTFGYELDPAKLSEDERADIRRQIDVFHRVNPLVRGGDFYRLAAPGAGPVTAWMSVAKDKSEFVFFAFRQAARPNPEIVTVRLAGLERDAVYCSCDGNEFTGEFLMNIGLRLPEAHGDAWSELICFRRK